MNKKKQIFLEAVRGLAALLVVFNHYFSAFYPSAIFGSDYQAHESWEKWFHTTPLGILFAGKAAVCLFFILSGYVLSLPYFGPDSSDDNHLMASLVKRPFRLAGIVIASEVAAYILLHTFGFYNAEVAKVSYSVPWFIHYGAPSTVGFKRLLSDVALNTFHNGALYNAPLWTIEIELYGSFLVFIGLLLFRKSSLRVLPYLCALIYFRSSLMQGFIFGMLVADFYRHHSKWISLRFSDWRLTYPLLLLGLVLASYPAYVSDADVAMTFYGKLPVIHGLGGQYSMLGALLVFVSVVLSASKQRMLEFHVFAFLGRISYALYAFHLLVLGTFSSWLFLHLLPRMGYHQSFLITLLLSLGLLIPASHYLSKYVDRPAAKLADQIGKIWLRSCGEKMTGEKRRVS